jgi:hypothetical protein
MPGSRKVASYGDVPVTVALVAEERHLGNRALVDAQAAWHAHGCRVEVVVPDAARLYGLFIPGVGVTDSRV